MVAHHLAKVRVAGSNPVVRSKPLRAVALDAGADRGGVAERRGNGLQSRVHGFESRLHLSTARAIGAAVARFPDTEEVTGSIPVSPTQVRGIITSVEALPERDRVTNRVTNS